MIEIKKHWVNNYTIINAPGDMCISCDNIEFDVKFGACYFFCYKKGAYVGLFRESAVGEWEE